MVRGPWSVVRIVTRDAGSPPGRSRRRAVTIVTAGCATSGHPHRVQIPTVPPAAGNAEEGIASWYGEPYHGRPTASGPRYDMWAMTAAHRTLPFGTVVRVRNLDSGREADVTINDRGPFVQGRILDLSRAAAEKLGAIGPGVIPVRLEVRRVGDGMPDEPCWEVQAGAFAREENARRARATLEAMGFSVRFAPAGGGLTRVRVTGLAGRARAAAVADLPRRRVPGRRGGPVRRRLVRARAVPLAALLLAVATVAGGQDAPPLVVDRLPASLAGEWLFRDRARPGVLKPVPRASQLAAHSRPRAVGAPGVARLHRPRVVSPLAGRLVRPRRPGPRSRPRARERRRRGVPQRAPDRLHGVVPTRLRRRDARATLLPDPARGPAARPAQRALGPRLQRLEIRGHPRSPAATRRLPEAPPAPGAPRRGRLLRLDPAPHPRGDAPPALRPAARPLRTPHVRGFDGVAGPVHHHVMRRGGRPSSSDTRPPTGSRLRARWPGSRSSPRCRCDSRGAPSPPGSSASRRRSCSAPRSRWCGATWPSFSSGSTRPRRLSCSSRASRCGSRSRWSGGGHGRGRRSSRRACWPSRSAPTSSWTSARSRAPASSAAISSLHCWRPLSPCATRSPSRSAGCSADGGSRSTPRPVSCPASASRTGWERSCCALAAAARRSRWRSSASTSRTTSVERDHSAAHAVASLRRGLRQIDLLARYDPETFALLLAETDERAAMTIIERLRRTVTQSGASRPGRARTTAGLAQYRPGRHLSADELLGEAEAALYAAVSEGGDCTATAP